MFKNKIYTDLLHHFSKIYPKVCNVVNTHIYVLCTQVCMTMTHTNNKIITIYVKVLFNVYCNSIIYKHYYIFLTPRFVEIIYRQKISSALCQLLS